MPSFAGAPKTQNGGFDPSTDHKTPALGSLSLGSMPNAGALAGTTGVETALITGPRFQRLTGNETIFRKGNVLDNTKGDWTDMLDGTENAVITKDYTLLVKGDVSETTMGATKQTFTGPMANIHKAEKKAEEPLEWFHHVMELFSYSWFHSDNFGAYSLVGGVGLTAFGVNTDLRVLDMAFKAVIGEMHAKELWVKEEKLDVVLMHQRVSVTETFVMAVEPGVGAAMMHEVGVTQEIFAVGANQVL